MVLGLMTLVGIPTTIGVWQGVSQSRKQPDPEEDARRSKECHLKVFCDSEQPESSEIHEKYVVLRDNKVTTNLCSSYSIYTVYCVKPTRKVKRN